MRRFRLPTQNILVAKLSTTSQWPTTSRSNCESRPSPSAKQRIKEFFLANIGTVVNKTQLVEIAYPVAEWARRVRELRDEDHWPILTNNDLATLKPGEYLMTGAPP